jgi:hypothetical protein
LFLLVVDLPNGSDFPKPVGNTAIQYFLSMRHSRIVLSYSSTHQCQIVVKYMSKRCQSYRMEAAMLFYTAPKTLRKRFSDWLFCEFDSISDWLISISDNAFMLTPDATLNGVLFAPTHAATNKNR